MKEKRPKMILRRVLVGRAWEVLEVAEQQYPEATRIIEEGLAHLISEGKFKNTVNGGQLLWFFRRLGLNLKLDTRIRVLEHGELKTLGRKLKENAYKL